VKSRRLILAGVAVYSVAVIVLADAALRDDPPAQTSPAIVTPPPPPTVVTIPLTSTSSSTSTTVAAHSTESAHDALQSDLNLAEQLSSLDPSLPCLEWAPLALEVGWPLEELPTLLPILWKESRCLPWADSGPDHGLAQVNQIHSEWLAQLGFTHEDMKDPRKNLSFSFLLWSSREESGKCGWTPWSVSCD
jgi:hypothetical protein